MMRPLRREYGQSYPPPEYGGNGGGGYQLQNNQIQNGGGMGGQQQQGGPMQQHQQQQQMHQQQQQHQQQQMQQGRPGQGPSGQPGPAGEGQTTAPPEMNLANVLHYLQSEWRRWERDRNEWEIERAEMRARIALLEGQRRSAENLKVDLLRRVKMLEFALRQERTKAGRSTASRLATLQDEDRSGRGGNEDKEGSGSSEGGDDIERVAKPNGLHASGMAKAASAAQRPVPDTTAWKNISGPPRDPKARARSREYLKQCLQEITYLTSPGALNPLPTRAPVQLDETSGEATAPERPRKSLPEQPIPPPSSQQPEEQQAQAQPSQEQAKEAQPEQQKQQASETPAELAANTNETSSSLPNGAYDTAPKEQAPATTSEAAPPSSPVPKLVPLPDGGEPSSAAPESREVLTAIYRPGDKASWRDQLKEANEAANQVPWPPRRTSDEEQLAGLTLVEEEEEGKPDEADGDRIWATRRVLKSHLDIVRGVAFAQGTDLTLVTGGDDCTVKVWLLDTPSVMSSSYRPLASSEIEPFVTYRGHSLPVTAVTVSASLGVVFSASMDSTIRLWRLSSRDDDQYAPYDPSRAIQTLEGHTDVVWDLCLMPPKPVNGANGGAAKPGSESQLVSVSADGTAKLWEERDGKWALKASFSDFDGATPTCLAVDNHDFSRVLVGLSNGLVKLYSLDDGQEVRSFGEPGSQVNAIISHPTLPTIITGHENGHLQFFDTKTGNPSPSLLAHPAPITSLALSPLSLMCILSSSVDCSVRLWDLQRKTSLQDLTGHRQRSDEGVTHVASHPELPIIASAGADGIVRIWGAG